VHTDHLNSPRRVSRASDNVVVWRWSSDPYGNGFADDDADGDGQRFTYNLRFPGQYYDAESGLNYNYLRNYDPAVGRYVESDPIGLRGGINTFAYALSNPAELVDPLGLLVWSNFTTYAFDLKDGDYAAFPGAQSLPVDSSVGGLTLVNWNIKAKCECSGSGAKFSEFVVSFMTNVHIRPGFPTEVNAWARRAEGDHVSDYLAWANSEGRKIAELREARYKGRQFSTQAECQATAAGLGSALSNNPGLLNTLIGTINKWDVSQLHNYSNPDRRP